MLSRLVLPFVILGCVAGCAPSYHEEFAVTGAPPSAAGTMFRNSDPKINDELARGYCADGYEKLSEQTQETDAGPIQEWRIRCTPYKLFGIL